MPSQWPNAYLLIRNADGDVLKRSNSFLWLSCRSRVNGIDRLRFEYPGGHEVLSLLAANENAQVELWRRDPRHGLDWYRHFSGLHLTEHRERQAAPGRGVMTSLGDRSLLARRIVAWYANTANRSAFTSEKAETIMKLLVQYNLTADATEANDRLEDGDHWPASLVSVETDGAGGNTVDWYCAYDNLLESLQGLARIAGGDFDLVKADLNTEALGWEFQWHVGQLGDDRTDSLTFAVGRGNLVEPIYDFDREYEDTVAIVAGPGENDERLITVRYGPNYSTDNHREVYVSAPNAETPGGRSSAGDKRLDQVAARDEFSFGLKQTDSCVYGRDFFLGDLATAVNPWTGANLTVKVNAVTVDLFSDGSTVIGGEAATP